MVTGITGVEITGMATATAVVTATGMGIGEIMGAVTVVGK